MDRFIGKVSTPRLGENNTPRVMDTVESCSLYDELTADNLAKTMIQLRNRQEPWI